MNEEFVARRPADRRDPGRRLRRQRLRELALDELLTGLGRLHDPPIDVVDRKPYELGREAARLVLMRLDRQKAPRRTVPPPTLFETPAVSCALREHLP